MNGAIQLVDMMAVGVFAISGALAAAEANLDALHAYSAEHFSLAETTGEEWPVVFGEVDALEIVDGAPVVFFF